jgi:hypothetical protein
MLVRMAGAVEREDGGRELYRAVFINGRVAYAIMSFGGFLGWARATIRCRGGC